MNFRHPAYQFVPAVILVCGVLLPALAQAQFFQQSPKLVGTGAIGDAVEGSSVAVSGDGNTAIVVGGPGDNNSAGAAWVYTRSSGVWSQQAKLVGVSIVGGEGPQQGLSVALSGDGNTAIVGEILTTEASAPPGCSRAQAGCGASRQNWLVQASSEELRSKAGL